MNQRLYTFILLLFFVVSCTLSAANYSGKVIDEAGNPVPFATVYLEQHPEIGTATGNQGQFTISCSESQQEQVIVSFIGYEVRRIRLAELQEDLQAVIVLHEQPIALQETVVAAKASKQKNKRKAMAQLLYKVYNRMQYDFSDEPTRYKIVSDVRMNTSGTPWGMEQMIANVVNIPAIGKDGRDSVQFAGEHCKRFFQTYLRERADSILAADWLQKDMRKAANEVDSGVVVHKALWAMGNIRYDFEQTMNDLRHWSVSNESEKETVLTHVESKNYIGIFKYEYRRHYIVDSETYRVRRFSEELTMALNVPFGYKFKRDDLELLNMLNMNKQQIEKFRLRKADAKITLNTIYQIQSGHIYPSEKNLHSVANLIGTKDMLIPIDVRATQHVTSLTPNAKPLSKGEQTRRLKRVIVEIY